MASEDNPEVQSERSDRRKVWSLPTEKVAYWFFRLNGCLTIENFVVHPDFDYLERGG
jgi:hypothetical protein